MTYDELCDFVNMGVRKDGADAFRVKRRRRIQVQGGTIPKSVTFTATVVVPTEMKLEGKAKELLMPEETLAHREHGVLFIPVVPVLLLRRGCKRICGGRARGKCKGGLLT